MRQAGAVSPETALPAAAFNEIINADIDMYVDAEVLREGPSGGFYLDEPTASRAMRDYTIKFVVFWLLVILVPVVILQLSNMR